MKERTRKRLCKKYSVPGDPILEIGENPVGWYIKYQSGKLVIKVTNGVYPIIPVNIPTIEGSVIRETRWF